MGLFLPKRTNKRLMQLVALCICLMLVFPLKTAFGATPASVTLQISQTITAQDSSKDPDTTVTYTLTALETGNPLPQSTKSEIHTFTLDGTGVGEVGPLVFNTAGVYTYELKLHDTLRPAGHVLDEQLYHISIHVRETSGTLVAETFVRQDGIKVASMTFGHAYAPFATDPALMVDPPVKKTVSGTPPKDSFFTFVLQAKDPTSPLPEGSINGTKTLTIQGSGEEDFGTWQYTRAGTYYYTVSEVNTGESGYTYDSTLYTITDVVRDEGGQLVLDRIVTNEANKPVSAYTFINTYEAASLKGPLTGDGTLSTPYIAGILIAGVVAFGCVWYLVGAARGRKKECGVEPLPES